MQRWKAISAVLEKPPACACGEPVGPDWAFCARCGRGLGRPRAYFGAATIAGVAVGVAVAAFIAGVLLGGRGGDPPANLAQADQAAELQRKLAGAEARARRLQDRNDALWRQLTDRNNALRKQLIQRHEALQTHLKQSTEAAKKQLEEQDNSIGLLANRAAAVEQLEEENAAILQSMQETEDELRSLLEMQETANQTPAPAAGEPERGETLTQEGIEAFWDDFDAEHPTVDGRAIWEESMRAAIDEFGPNAEDLRERATRMFEERLAEAEELARGTPALEPSDDPEAAPTAADDTSLRQRRRTRR